MFEVGPDAWLAVTTPAFSAATLLADPARPVEIIFCHVDLADIVLIRSVRRYGSGRVVGPEAGE